MNENFREKLPSCEKKKSDFIFPMSCVACNREPAIYPSAFGEPRIGDKCFEKMKLCTNPIHDHNIEDDIACMECFAEGCVFETKEEEKHVLNNDSNIPTDVTWTDHENNTYYLNSVILARQSKVFCNMYEEKENFNHPMNFSSTVLKDFIKLIYLQYDYHCQSITTILNSENMVNMWKICHQYECLIEHSVANFIMVQKLDKLTDEMIIDVLKTAISFKHAGIIKLYINNVVKTQKIEVLKSLLMSFGTCNQENTTTCDLVAAFSEPIVVFSPEPQSKSDVTWTDDYLNMYHLHIAVLARHSRLFISCQHMDETPKNVNAFAELCYLQYSENPTMLTLETMIPLWKMCYKYNCLHLATVVWGFISAKIRNAEISNDVVFELFHTAIVLDQKEAIIYILEHISCFQMTKIIGHFLNIELDYDFSTLKNPRFTVTGGNFNELYANMHCIQ
jgi:hypothetical protein